MNKMLQQWYFLKMSMLWTRIVGIQFITATKMSKDVSAIVTSTLRTPSTSSSFAFAADDLNTSEVMERHIWMPWQTGN
jgi:hypothetical protein